MSRKNSASGVPVLRLPDFLERSLSAGHPWIYRDHLPAHHGLAGGSWVEVHAGDSTAYALYDAESPIALRVFSTREVPDRGFVLERVRAAYQLRQPLRDDGTTAYRWLFGEADGLPGLSVDVYGGYAVVLSYAASLDVLLEPLADALQQTAELSGVLWRKAGDAVDRLSLLRGAEPPAELVVVEHGARFQADLRHGQKSGLFLDHRENRRTLAPWCAGRRVLNLFSYTGAFSVHAALAGAAKLTSVDSAAAAGEAARKNFRLNDLDPDRHEFVTSDVFKYLEKAISRAERFDVVICDPPSFAKNRAQKPQALKAYKRLNAEALRALAPAGLFAAASCTSQVSPEEFREALAESARRAKRRLQIIHEAGQPLDHPQLAQHPEGRYLKFVVSRALAPV